VRGEHRPDVQGRNCIGEPDFTTTVMDRGDRAGQPILSVRSSLQSANSIHLLGNIRKMEVGRERPSKQRRGIDRHSPKQVPQLLTRTATRRVLAEFGEGAHSLYQRESGRALLAGQGLT